MFKKKPKYDPMTMAFMNLPQTKEQAKSGNYRNPEAYETGVESAFSTLGTILKLLICIPFLPIIIPIIILKAMLGD
ncbi:hypothetical protein ACSXBI_15030 (plasmid) [Clostridium perfringens]